MEPYWQEQISLSTFLDYLYGWRWRVFEGARLPMQAPTYFFSQGSLSTRLDSKALVVGLLTPWYRPRCSKCHQPHTSCRCQLRTQNPAMYHSLAHSLWYLSLAGIYKKRCDSCIFWAIWACKLICLPGITLKKDRKTWLSTCNYTWFWDACYSARLYCLERSFVAWHLYCGLVFEDLGRGGGSASTRLSVLRAQRIIFRQFSNLSGDQDLPHQKRKDSIRNWVWRVCSRYWRSWHCCRRTPQWEKIVPNHFAQSWQRLRSKLSLYYSAFWSAHPFKGGK